jgi:uncharacterized protein YjiS (DUF1127 family)
MKMSLLTTLFRRAERRRALADLMSYDDRLLRDIGLTRTELSAMRYRQASPGRGHE